MKFLVRNYSCLQNPWLRGYRPQIPVLSVLCPQLNLLNPPRKKFLGTPLIYIVHDHVADKSCKEDQNKFYVQQLFSENLRICMIMLKNTEEPDRPHDDIIRRMRIACWIHMATNTHSECVLLIAFPLQNWLQRTRLSATLQYIACLDTE